MSETILDELMASFKRFKLSKADLRIIEAHLRCIQSEGCRKFSHNYIIIGEGKEPEILADYIAHNVCDLMNIEGKITTMSETKMLDSDESVEEFRKCDALIINDCMSQDKYEGDLLTSLSTTEKVEKNNTVWNSAMNAFLRFPTKTIFLCTDRETFETRYKNWNYMTDVVFPYHIVLNDADSEEIVAFCISRLRNYKFEDGFLDGLREYVTNVYPTSSIKGEEFATHLSNKIIYRYYSIRRFSKVLSADCLPSYEKISSEDEILNRLNRFVGLNKAKEQLSNLLYIGEDIKESGEYPFLNFVFRGEPGTGKTSIAKEMANLLYSTGVIKRNNVYEVTASDLLGAYTGQTGKITRRICKKAYGGVLFIDEAYSLNPYNGASNTDTFKADCIAELVNEMSAHKKNLCIIFAGYPNQMDEFINSNPGLKSRIGYTIDFEDYSSDELVEIFCRCADKKGYRIDTNAMETIRKSITAAKYDDNFANARSVENLFYKAQIECRKNRPGSRVLYKEDIVIDKKTQNYDELMIEFESKTGLSEAKSILKELINTYRFYKENDMESEKKNNMLFVGSPGTGKSMTAELFGKMLFEANLAKSPKFISISAGNLLCEERGALMKYCEKAKGGILFIDEIYMLSTNSLIQGEVISVLLDVLENQKYDLSVILAGYENEVQNFLSTNKGLASRFPISVHFEDYTKEELGDIFTNLCKEKGFEMNPGAINTMKGNIEVLMQKHDFANARDIKTMFDTVIRKHATNYYTETQCNYGKTLTEKDFLDAEKRMPRSGCKTIGFVTAINNR